MKRLLFTFAIACALIPLNAQETLTLSQCLRMGIENNLQLQTRRNDIAKGGHAITENRAKLLPQINAVVSMNDNFNPPVSVTDGSAYGNPYNVTKTLQYNASAGLQLLQKQGELSEKQQKMVQQGYLPSLMLTGNFTYSAFTDKFSNWFHSGPSNHWYNSSGLGITLRVPVFDGLEKRSKIRKAKLDVENARLAYDDALKGLRTQYLNATNDLMNSRRNFTKQLDNYRLAEDVYAVTTDRYREGIASMTEVLQDEMQMSEAQNNYVTAHYSYRLTALSLLRLTGQLDSLLK